MHRAAPTVERANEAANAAVEAERQVVVRPERVGMPIATNSNRQPLIEVSHLTQTTRDGIPVIVNLREDVMVGHPGYLRAVTSNVVRTLRPS